MDTSTKNLESFASELESISPERRIHSVIERWGCDEVVASTSFGLQAAVLLHLISRAAPKVKIVFVDTGYLFAETLEYARRLQDTWNLNVKIFHPQETPSEQEARWGKLWEQGEEGLSMYNYVNKVEPLERAFAELKPRVWLSGLRRVQSESRRFRPVIEEKEEHGGIVKVYPLIDWSDKDIFFYQQENRIPEHPLWAKGYVSVGDRHSSEPLQIGQAPESTRFGGVKRECGLHA